MTEKSLAVAPEVEEAILTRRSVRAFTSKPVSKATLTRLLDLAARAASSTNSQPWHVYAVAGQKRDEISQLALKAWNSGDRGEQEFQYYPQEWYEPYLSRRRQVGFALYGLLGIRKDDKERADAQQARNLKFFDAPVGLFITTERRILPQGIFDSGLFTATLMIAARGMGLATCPQLSWTHYHKLLRPLLGIPDDQLLLTGMALGYEDESAIENSLRTVRAPTQEFCHFMGFEG